MTQIRTGISTQQAFIDALNEKGVRLTNESGAMAFQKAILAAGGTVFNGSDNDTVVAAINQEKEQYYDTISKIDDYFYEINYSSIDYRYGELMSQGRFQVNIGACSSVRNGNYYGRNYDWYYDNTVTFVVSTPSTPGHFATVGVVGSLDELNKDSVASGEWVGTYKALPFMIVDGINEKGLVCNINVVPHEDGGCNVSTIPDIELRDRVCQICLPRYVLDKFETAKEAVDYIKNYVSIYPVKAANLELELHMMVGDANDTYCLEILNNEIKIINMNVTKRPYMTNFYVYNTKVKDDKIDVNSLTPFASGVERYNKIMAGYDTADTYEGMFNLMKSIWYTRAYSTDEDPVWCTEFVGDYRSKGLGVLTAQTDPSKFTKVLNIVRDMFNNRTREVKNTWQTVHTCIFDLTDNTMHYYDQETNTEHVYTPGTPVCFPTVKVNHIYKFYPKKAPIVELEDPDVYNEIRSSMNNTEIEDGITDIFNRVGVRDASIVVNSPVQGPNNFFTYYPSNTEHEAGWMVAGTGGTYVNEIEPFQFKVTKIKDHGTFVDEIESSMFSFMLDKVEDLGPALDPEDTPTPED